MESCKIEPEMALFPEVALFIRLPSAGWSPWRRNLLI